MIMSYAYNSQSLTYPGQRLQDILLYTDINRIRNDCDLLGLKFVNENVHFQKSKFNAGELLVSFKSFAKKCIRQMSL